MWAEEANFDGVGSELPVWDVGCGTGSNCADAFFGLHKCCCVVLGALFCAYISGA